MADERLTSSLQENLITLLCYDDKEGRIVANLAEPELFEGEYRTIAERAIDYWNRHKAAPGDHTADLVGDILDDKGNRKSGTYRRILRNMALLSESVNSEYVMTQLRQFTRMQRMKDAILKSAEKLNAQRELAIGEVEVILADLLRARQVGFEPGLSLLEVGRVVEFLSSHFSEFRTGIVPLDEKNISPVRGGVLLFLAPTGKGKTWFLVHIGKHGILQRKKVLHISLEISEEEVAQRYYQALFSIPKHESEVKTARLIFDEDGKLESFDKGMVKRKHTFDDKDITKTLHREIKPWSKRLQDNVIIKRFPTRGLSMNGLRAYLDGLEMAHNFIPDLVILDYIGITETDVNNPRSTLGRAFEDFRAIMVERNMAGVTAHQTSKVGAEANIVKATHVAEDWSLIMTADMAITYSQTTTEERLGLARLFVAKARSEKDKFGMILTQSYAMGQFALQSAPLRKMYYEYLDSEKKERGGEGDEDD